jgi:hypothetical protein
VVSFKYIVNFLLMKGGENMRRIKLSVRGIGLVTKNILLGDKQYFCETPKAWGLWGQLDGLEYRFGRWPKNRVVCLLINEAWEVQ